MTVMRIRDRGARNNDAIMMRSLRTIDSSEVEFTWVIKPVPQEFYGEHCLLLALSHLGFHTVLFLFNNRAQHFGQCLIMLD